MAVRHAIGNLSKMFTRVVPKYEMYTFLTSTSLMLLCCLIEHRTQMCISMGILCNYCKNLMLSYPLPRINNHLDSKHSTIYERIQLCKQSRSWYCLNVEFKCLPQIVHRHIDGKHWTNCTAQYSNGMIARLICIASILKCWRMLHRIHPQPTFSRLPPQTLYT